MRRPVRRGLPGWVWLAGSAAAVVVVVVVVLAMRNGSRPETPDGTPVAAKGAGGDDRPKDADKAMDTDPARNKDKKDKTDTPEKPAPLPDKFKNSLGMEFVRIPKGKSWLGGGRGRPGDKEVVIPHDYYLGKYLVTQQEWQNVMGRIPAGTHAQDRARIRCKVYRMQT